MATGTDHHPPGLSLLACYAATAGIHTTPASSPQRSESPEGIPKTNTHFNTQSPSLAALSPPPPPSPSLSSPPRRSSHAVPLIYPFRTARRSSCRLSRLLQSSEALHHPIHPSTHSHTQNPPTHSRTPKTLHFDLSPSVQLCILDIHSPADMHFQWRHFRSSKKPARFCTPPTHSRVQRHPFQ